MAATKTAPPTPSSLTSSSCVIRSLTWFRRDDTGRTLAAAAISPPPSTQTCCQTWASASRFSSTREAAAAAATGTAWTLTARYFAQPASVSSLWQISQPGRRARPARRAARRPAGCCNILLNRNFAAEIVGRMQDSQEERQVFLSSIAIRNASDDIQVFNEMFVSC